MSTGDPATDAALDIAQRMASAVRVGSGREAAARVLDLFAEDGGSRDRLDEIRAALRHDARTEHVLSTRSRPDVGSEFPALDGVCSCGGWKSTYTSDIESSWWNNHVKLIGT